MIVEPRVEIVSAGTCPYAQRTRMALIEKSIPFELTEIDLDDKPDWFLAVSPYGKVPLVRHGDDVVFESAVINEYLEEVFPETPLLPADPAGRAAARIWIDFANVRFAPHIYKGLMAEDADERALHTGILRERLAHMEAEGPGKSGGPFWLGPELTLVDLTFLPHMHRLDVAYRHYRGLGVSGDHPHLAAWLATMNRRESVRATSADPETLIRNWRKYAENTSTGTTARDFRAS